MIRDRRGHCRTRYLHSQHQQQINMLTVINTSVMKLVATWTFNTRTNCSVYNLLILCCCCCCASICCCWCCCCWCVAAVWGLLNTSALQDRIACRSRGPSCIDLLVDGWTYWSFSSMWSELVCSMAFTSWPIRLSSRVAKRLLASSATRGWNSNERFKAVETVDRESDIGSSLSTTRERCTK